MRRLLLSPPFDEAAAALAGVALVQQRYGVDQAPRIALQFVYQWLDRVDDPRFEEGLFDQLWHDFAAELDEPDWVFRAVANVRWLTAEGGPFEFGDGVSIRGRSVDELRDFGFSEHTLAALSEDWAGFGASSYVMLIETRAPNSPESLVLVSPGTEVAKAWRVLGALRLLAPGDITIGRMWMSRPARFDARFDVGLGAVSPLESRFPPSAPCTT
jgi:hypothetical protein